MADPAVFIKAHTNKYLSSFLCWSYARRAEQMKHRQIITGVDVAAVAFLISTINLIIKASINYVEDSYQGSTPDLYQNSSFLFSCNFTTLVGKCNFF